MLKRNKKYQVIRVIETSGEAIIEIIASVYLAMERIRVVTAHVDRIESPSYLSREFNSGEFEFLI